jgi:hypothetical protein
VAWLYAWMVFRVLRWLLWVAFAAYNVEFLLHRPSHLNQFGHLLPTTELWMFVLPCAAVFVGFFEILARERAGVLRPSALRDWSGVRAAQVP